MLRRIMRRLIQPLKQARARQICRKRGHGWTLILEKIWENDPDTIDIYLDYYLSGDDRVDGWSFRPYFILMGGEFDDDIRRNVAERLLAMLRSQTAPKQSMQDTWVSAMPGEPDPWTGKPPIAMNSRVWVMLRIIEKMPTLRGECSALARAHLTDAELNLLIDLL